MKNSASARTRDGSVPEKQVPAKAEATETEVPENVNRHFILKKVSSFQLLTQATQRALWLERSTTTRFNPNSSQMFFRL